MQLAKGDDIAALLRDSGGPGADGVDDLVAGLHRRLASEATRYTLPLDGSLTLDIGSTVREVLTMSRGPALEDYATRATFLRATSRALRQLLVKFAEHRRDGGAATGPGGDDEHAGVQVRGNDRKAADLRVGRVIFDGRTTSILLKVDAALTSLEAIDPVRAEVAICILFGRLNVSAIAAALGCPAATVKKHWALGHIWLYRCIQDPKRLSVQDGRQS